MARPQVLGGYVLGEKLGEGGMGVVYSAHHPSMPGRKFAIKVLLGDGPPSAQSVARFTREMQALASATTHPNVVKIHAGSVDGARPWFVMDLIEGPSLEELVRRGALDPNRAVRIVRDVAHAIEHVHAQGIVHRDLKPGNVLLDENEVPRVCDFGLARFAEAERLTRTGTFVGTPYYAAPEQLSGGTVDARSDVYSLGAILWFALVGRPPFEGGSRLELVALVTGTAPTPPSRETPGVPAAIDAIVLHALEKDPAKRYPTAREFREDLERFLEGKRPWVAPPERSPRRAVLALLVLGAAMLPFAIKARIDRTKRSALEEKAAAALADDSVPSLREALAALEAGRAPGELVARVRSRLALRELDATLAALPKKASAADLLAAARGAGLCGAPSSLVGEKPGLALGDALLDARDEAIEEHRGSPEELLRAAEELARVRLAEKPEDPAGRGLRALLALARAGAPRRPLGPGALGVPEAKEPSLLADLAAARELGGGAGGRFAWLLVDLLVAAPGAPGLEEAVEKARLAAPQAPERASLERVVAAEPGWRGFQALFTRFREPGHAPEAAWELSRFFARAGAPSAFEHPELASDPSEAAVQRALAHDRPRAFALVTPRPDPPELFARLVPIGTELSALHPTDEFSMLTTGDPWTKIQRRFAPSRPRIMKEAVEAVKIAPTSESVLHLCSDQIFDLVSAQIFAILQSRESGYIQLLICQLDPGDREGTRTGYGNPFGPSWESKAETPLPRCRDIDAQLARDMARDERIQALAPLLEPGALERATAASAGLRRTYELTGDEPVPAAELDELTFEASTGLDALERLGGSTVLTFRPRLRSHEAFGDYGAAAAALDLERALRVSAPPTHEDTALYTSCVAFTARLPSWGKTLGLRLYRAAVMTNHERRMREALDLPREVRVERFADRLNDVVTHITVRKSLTALRSFYRKSDFEPTAEDKARLLAAPERR